MHFTLILLYLLLINSLPELIHLNLSHCRRIQGLSKLEIIKTFYLLLRVFLRVFFLLVLFIFDGFKREVFYLNDLNSLINLKGISELKGIKIKKGLRIKRGFSRTVLGVRNSFGFCQTNSMSTLHPTEDSENEGNYSTVEEAVDKMMTERAERADRVVKELQDSKITQVVPCSEADLVQQDELADDLGLGLGLSLEIEKSFSDLSKHLLLKSSFNTPYASEKASVLISELLKEKGIDVVGPLPKGLLGEKKNYLSAEVRKHITKVKKKLDDLEVEALSAKAEDCEPVDLITSLDMLLLTDKSSLIDVKRNILVVQEILRDINSMTKKGYVNSGDLLTNLNSNFMTRCISSMIIYANKRILPKSE